MACGRSGQKLYVIFLLIVVLSCFGTVAAARHEKLTNPASWKNLTFGFGDKMVAFIGLMAALVSGWIAIMASNQKIPNVIALPLIVYGSFVFYIGCAATINMFGKEDESGRNFK